MAPGGPELLTFGRGVPAIWRLSVQADELRDAGIDPGRVL
jgi:hypothetical protein